jgi:hypothetical protein
MPKTSSRSYTVVGQLMPNRAAALRKLTALRKADPANQYDWGVAEIRPSTGERPYELGKIHLPPSPAFLKELEGLLLRRDVFRKTQAGQKAMRLIRVSLKRR